MVPRMYLEPEAMLIIEPLRGWAGRLFHSANMPFGNWDISEEAADLHGRHHPREEVWNVVTGDRPRG